MEDQRDPLPILFIVIISIALVGILFFLKGDVGFRLGDEGHLWYCANQTAQGDVPIRDFRSYDPGRYYWAAACSQALGSGLVSLRFANAIVQFIGLTLGLLAISRVTKRKEYLILAGCILTIWACNACPESWPSG